jgi:hypothetical protein
MQDEAIAIAERSSIVRCIRLCQCFSFSVVGLVFDHNWINDIGKQKEPTMHHWSDLSFGPFDESEVETDVTQEGLIMFCRSLQISLTSSLVKT